MASAEVPVFVSAEEYLRTAYEPDTDYLDGVLEGRNAGEFEHQAVLRAFLLAFFEIEGKFGFYAAMGIRVQVAATRYRVPDLCLLPSDRLPKRIVIDPPQLCIEVLSPEDRFGQLRVKCEDYLRMGIPEVWIVDPEQRKAYVLTPDRVLREHGSGPLQLGGTEISVVLEEVFQALDLQG